MVIQNHLPTISWPGGILPSGTFPIDIEELEISLLIHLESSFILLLPSFPHFDFPTWSKLSFVCSIWGTGKIWHDN